MSAPVQKTVEIPITIEDDVPMVAQAEAGPGDTIVWHAGSDTVSIWFPGDGVFASRELATRGTGDIEIEIQETAPEGTYHYAVFSHGKQTFAEGGSHPVMIIKKP